MSFQMFLSYRRDDARLLVGRVAEKLEQCFGKGSVFLDLDGIPFGEDFRERLDGALAQCKVFLVLIGERWLEARDEKHNRRLDDPGDFVRREIETALDRGIPLIPLLIGRATMPTERVLPPSLSRLVHRQAAEIDPVRNFDIDMNRLVSSLRGMLSPRATSRDVEVKLSMAMSVDGFIDDSAPRKLVLSNSADWDQVDIMRMWCDAIMVGATTIRQDDPRLLIRNEHRQREREQLGRSANPAKITLTESGRLDSSSAFFKMGNERKIVYCPNQVADGLREVVGNAAEVCALDGNPIIGKSILDDLAAKGVRRLMLEGGTNLATLFLQEGLVDEMRVAIAPFFIGEATAPRFVNVGVFPHVKGNGMKLRRVEAIEDMAVLHYSLKRLDGSTDHDGGTDDLRENRLRP